MDETGFSLWAPFQQKANKSHNQKQLQSYKGLGSPENSKTVSEVSERKAHQRVRTPRASSFPLFVREQLLPE